MSLAWPCLAQGYPRLRQHRRRLKDQASCLARSPEARRAPWWKSHPRRSKPRRACAVVKVKIYGPEGGNSIQSLFRTVRGVLGLAATRALTSGFSCSASEARISPGALGSDAMSNTLSFDDRSKQRCFLGLLDMAQRWLSCRLEEGCFLRRFTGTWPLRQSTLRKREASHGISSSPRNTRVPVMKIAWAPSRRFCTLST